jgi:hypothetical protein
MIKRQIQGEQTRTLQDCWQAPRFYMQVPKNTVPSKYSHSFATLIGTYQIWIPRKTLPIFFSVINQMPVALTPFQIHYSLIIKTLKPTSKYTEVDSTLINHKWIQRKLPSELWHYLVEIYWLFEVTCRPRPQNSRWRKIKTSIMSKKAEMTFGAIERKIIRGMCGKIEENGS